MSKKECQHEWLPLGNDRWSCKNCAKVKVGYVEELKQQLADKDKEIQEWKDGTMIVKYEKQLAEKDKEIERLETSKDWYKNNYNDICKRCEDYNKNLRHQICEEFRGQYYEKQEVKPPFEFVRPDEVDKILDQIEKGE